MIPTYFISHQEGEGDDARYSVSRQLDKNVEEHESIAVNVLSKLANRIVHEDAKGMGFELYCISGFPLDSFYQKGGAYAGSVDPSSVVSQSNDSRQDIDEQPADPHLQSFHDALSAGYKGTFYEWHKEHFGTFWCPDIAA